MDFSSKFLKGFDNSKKTIDIDRIFKFKKKKEIILPLGSCFLDNFSTELKKKKFNICFNPKPNIIANDAYQFFFGNFDNPLNLLNNLRSNITK